MVDVLIQTHNEEMNLPHALQSLQGWAHQIFVVDSGSTDSTLEIAQRYGAKVVHHDWEGYAGQKNWAIANLPWESQWILIVDADEAVTPELRKEIERVTSAPIERVLESGFYLNRMFIFMGRQIRHCGYYPSWNLRLFKRGRAKYENRRVHEHMIVDGSTAYLKGILLHEDRRGIEHFIAKHNRYSTLEAQEIYASNVPWPGIVQFLSNRMVRRRFLKTRILPALPAPWLWKFLYMYVFLEGFMDRAAGWNLCFFIATYEYFIHVKYKELKRLRGRQALISGLSVSEGKLSESDPTVRRRRAVAAPAAPPEAIPRALIAPILSPAAGLAVALPTAVDGESTGGWVEDPAAVPRTGRAPVSVLIPTFNDAQSLPRCLDHLTWAEEVVIVDSGSQDQTRAIAGAYGAGVVHFSWNGRWPKKKNWALKNVPFKHPWVLIVGPDEWVPPELADEIEQAVTGGENAAGGPVGYNINRKYIFMGGWIRHCGYYPSWTLRLIKRGFGQFQQLAEVSDITSGDDETHEYLVADGLAEYLHSDMLNLSYANVQTFLEKHNRYSNWEAAVQHASSQAGETGLGARMSLRLHRFYRRLPFRPALRFFYSYVLRGGFLDGRRGYLFCRLLALSEFLSVTKYAELKRGENGQSLRSLSAVPEGELSAAIRAR